MLAGSSEVGAKHGCLLSKSHSVPSCAFSSLIISSLAFLGYFLMQKYLSEGSRGCFKWSVFYLLICSWSGGLEE